MTDDVLMETLKSLPAQQRAEVKDFVEFLAAKTKKARGMGPAAGYCTGIGSSRR